MSTEQEESVRYFIGREDDFLYPQAPGIRVKKAPGGSLPGLDAAGWVVDQAMAMEAESR